MSEKSDLKVNFKNLTNAITRLTKKYKIIGGSWTGKYEPIALKLSEFCVRVNDELLKDSIILLLNQYEDDDLNRKHTFIGISSSDLLIFLFNKEMKLSIENNRLTTRYYGKTLITTRNLHGLLSEDISLPSEDIVQYEVKMTVDINCKRVSFKDDMQESSSSDTITQQSSSSDTITQQDESNDTINQQEDDLKNVFNQESSSNDTINQQEDDSKNVVNKESSLSVPVIQQKDDSKSDVINDRISNVIMISIVASFIVFLKLKII